MARATIEQYHKGQERQRSPLERVNATGRIADFEAGLRPSQGASVSNDVLPIDELRGDPVIDVVNLALPFFGLMLAGAVAARLFHIEERTGDRLNILVLYFALPAMIFRTVASAPFEQLLNWPFIFATSVSTFIVFALAFAFASLVLQARVHVAGLQASSASYGNVGYMGLILSVVAFGEAAAVPAILIFCFDLMIQFVLVPLAGAIGTSAHGTARRDLATIIARSVLLHPFFVATAAGAASAAIELQLPTALDTFLEMMARAAAPSALFALGITLSKRRFAGVGSEFPVIVGLKMFAHPLIVLVVLSLIGGFDPLWISVAVLMAALPTAASVYIFAEQYDAYLEGASSSILVTTLVSAITVPALLFVIEQGYLPYELF
jgi:malonate transporter and related proteins